LNKCNGCGACAKACPAEALAVKDGKGTTWCCSVGPFPRTGPAN